MITTLKNELAGALIALGKLICRTSPLAVYKTLQIEAENGKLNFTTCSAMEQITFKLSCNSGDSFCVLVSFDEFRDAVRAERSKTLTLNLESGTLLVGERRLALITDVTFPAVQLGEHCSTSELPANFLEIFSAAAPLVDRNDPRPHLRGINFSRDGITATNGKELLNVFCPLELDDYTIPLPLALMQSKTDEAGILQAWSSKDSKFICIETVHWRWVCKCLNGSYPNWRHIVPQQQNLVRSVKFSPDDTDRLITFLKGIPDNPPQNRTHIYPESDTTVCIESDDLHIVIPAEFTGEWQNASLWINRNMLLHLLSEGHTKLELSNGYSPIVATGGIGKYVAMPLYPVKQQENTESKQQPTTQTKENKMETEDTKTAQMSNVRTFTPANNANNEAETLNPLDDLISCIEAFKVKLKAALDESAALSRKVKEAQIQQKQKERDFIQAKRAIERIKIASSF